MTLLLATFLIVDAILPLLGSASVLGSFLNEVHAFVSSVESKPFDIANLALPPIYLLALSWALAGGLIWSKSEELSDTYLVPSMLGFRRPVLEFDLNKLFAEYEKFEAKGKIRHPIAKRILRFVLPPLYGYSLAGLLAFPLGAVAAIVLTWRFILRLLAHLASLVLVVFQWLLAPLEAPGADNDIPTRVFLSIYRTRNRLETFATNTTPWNFVMPVKDLGTVRPVLGRIADATGRLLILSLLLAILGEIAARLLLSRFQ